MSAYPLLFELPRWGTPSPPAAKPIPLHDFRDVVDAHAELSGESQIRLMRILNESFDESGVKLGLL
jgi:hypothetical protein